MEPRFLLTFAFLSCVTVVSHATLSSQQYWSSALPNTPMPKIIKDLLSYGTNLHAGGHKGKPRYVASKPGVGDYSHNQAKIYHYAATKDELGDPHNVALFFLEKNLRPNTKLTLYLPKTSPVESSFLPHELAKKLPFSSDKLPQILDQFSVKPATLEAKLIENTIKECEAPNTVGSEDQKYCATSLESMVDFSTSKLGNKVTAISTEVDKATNLQEFAVSSVVKKSVHDKAVVCHRQSYPYAVFYCHSIQHMRAYKVGLVGADGTKVDAVAVCHLNTSVWNPKHLAFQVLKVKPGTVPVCHFVTQDNVVWVSK